jgi:ribonuclease-3
MKPAFVAQFRGAGFLSGLILQGLDVEQATVEQCQQLIGYRFSDPGLLTLALTHASVAPTRLESNERLEFLGDAVLGLIVCHELYARRTELLEGDLTKIKSAVVARQVCAEVAEEAGICELLHLGKGMPDPTGLPQSVAAAVFEAIIGAIYLDGGLEEARRFVLAHVQKHIRRALSDEHQRNYKSLLQQYSQRHWGSTPSYLLLDEKGPDHTKCFEMAASINGRHFQSAWGNSKKEAEQEAARQALIELSLLPEEDQG